MVFDEKQDTRADRYDGFVYIWMNTRSRKFYIGSHMGTTDDGYVGSGTLFAIKYYKEPENFKRRILQYVSGDVLDIRAAEEKWLALIEDGCLHGVKYYNRTKTVSFSEYSSLGTRWVTDGINLKKIYPDQEVPDGWWLGHTDKKLEQLRSFRHTEEAKEAIRKFRTGIPHSPERIQKQKDTKKINENRWYTNGVESYQFSKDEEIPEGWYLGRTKAWESGSGSKGRTKISDGVSERYLKPGEDLPDGWYVGLAKSVREAIKGNKGQTGRVVINNGVDEKFLDKGQDIQAGWNIGRISSSVRGKMVINNGIEQKYVLRGNTPEGWSRGRLQKESHR